MAIALPTIVKYWTTVVVKNKCDHASPSQTKQKGRPPEFPGHHANAIFPNLTSKEPLSTFENKTRKQEKEKE